MIGRHLIVWSVAKFPRDTIRTECRFSFPIHPKHRCARSNRFISDRPHAGPVQEAPAIAACCPSAQNPVLGNLTVFCFSEAGFLNRREDSLSDYPEVFGPAPVAGCRTLTYNYRDPSFLILIAFFSRAD